MQVTYHQEGKATVYEVLRKHPDGTVDIGPKDGEPVVTKCKITDKPVIGSATESKEVKTK